MKKTNTAPGVVNKTEKLSVPAATGEAYRIVPEGKVEYPRGEAEGDKAPNTRDLTPKLTHGK